MIRKNALISGLLAATMLPLPTHAAAATAKPAAQSRVTDGTVKLDYGQFTLPNGLTVLVHTDHTVPSVFVGVWYRTGSKDEPKGRTGFAHLFEHLMFQPTANRKGEYFDLLTRAGATGMNGTTTMDWTNYFETVPSNALDLALWMESDRMGHLMGGITQAVLDEQRRVVKNEKRQHELQPGGRGHERYLENYFPAGHPYRHTTIGSMKDIDGASLADVRQWYADYYGASNAVLVLVGDVDLEEAKQKTAHYFSDVPAGKPVDHLDEWVPSFNTIKRDKTYDNVSAISVTRSWPLSNDDPYRNTLLQLAARTLTGSKQAWLNKRLVDGRQILSGIAANVSENSLASSFDLSYGLRPGVTPEQAGKAVDEALAAYFAQGPAKEDLDTVVASTDVTLVRSLESNAQIGNFLIGSYLGHGDPLYFLKQRDWIADATPAQVKAVAEKALSHPYFEAQVLPSPVGAAPAAATVDRSAPPQPGEASHEVYMPPISQTTLANGMKLVVAERHNLPVVDFSMVFETGSLAEGPYAQGAAKQAFNLLSLGSKKYDAAAISRETGRIGMTIGSSTSKSQSSFSWSAIDKHLDRSFAIASEILRNPVYPQSGIDPLLANVDTQFDSYERNPINAAGPVYNRAMWGEDHPNGRILTREEARAFSRDAIVRFHDHEIGPNDATLYMVGDITLERARALAEKYFGNWRKVSPVGLDSVPAPMPKPGRVILVDAPGAPQSSISAGEFVGPFDENRAPAEVLAGMVLGGAFDSRLNMNLREDKGWAYGFGSGIANAPKGPRLFTASGTVEADKTALSMAEIRKEIAGFATTSPATQPEIDANRDAMIKTIPLSLGNGGAVLSTMIGEAAYGQPFDRIEGKAARLEAVTLDDVRAAARADYRPDQLTWVVVGDLKVIEKDIRALGLGPVEVWDVYGNRVR
ncbi:M16 family metallopeptidase [Novosphingobium beihaiensis]|uniref:Insulinase family protein n=1 Tax=Novosphingobium beihaiensis TaxID=2930389 RepID=A0ABT0BL65_9SPHN|nr:pitrilysin family protein [Novosphingobium beihaiensis]MCJ2185792.1 insulinase family protein [Novosphingobium beihaiensis]